MSGPADKIGGARRVVVGICTYNRPAGLRAVLAAIDHQRLTTLDDGQIELVIADNSAAGSAKDASDAYARTGRFAVHYVAERRKGLSYARNAVLAVARELDATHLAFVDDDELPDPGWLEALLHVVETGRCAAAIGPVYPVFEVPPPAWLPKSAFVIRRRPSDGLVDDGYTCNSIVSLSAVAACDLRFDARFNETGGEDTFFFKQLLKRNFPIAWAEQAVVYETVPRHRMRASWLWRRWFRTGALEVYLQRHDPDSVAGKLTSLGNGLARLAVGAPKIAVGGVRAALGNPSAFIASFYTLCRGAGLVAKVFGRDHKEYSVPTYR